MSNIESWISGKPFDGSGTPIEVENPRTEESLGCIRALSVKEASEAICSISKEKEAWAALTFKKRAEVIFSFRELFKKYESDFVLAITEENGKTEEEARAEVSKAIELCEFASSLPSLLAGKTEFVSTGIEVKELHQPVGIVASITPFNFPLMVPMWTIPNALVSGNAFILKPSEKTPKTALLIAKLLKEAGLPDGLFSVFQGGKEIVEVLCDDPRVDVVTFVGSTPIAKVVYQRSTHNLKRCLAMGGAKNHIIVMPDSQPDITAKEVLNAGFGMSGQRCMAASTILVVGENKEFLDELQKQTEGWRPSKELGPLSSKEARLVIEDYLDKTKGTRLVDGRDTEKPESGYYIGGSIIVYDTYEDMGEEEVFGPVLEVVHCESLEEALEFQNRSPYANGASIFTGHGESAMLASLGFSSGMIGVNIGVPVPRDPFSFGGLKASKFGVGDITGYQSLQLFTNTKKITTKWNPEHKKDWMS